jgi:hypothetical protein
LAEDVLVAGLGRGLDNREHVLGERYLFRGQLLIGDVRSPKSGLESLDAIQRIRGRAGQPLDPVRLFALQDGDEPPVLDAHGWSDILPAYDFREQLDESTRLTWAEDTRDEILARLLELNRVMAAQEAEESAAAEGAKPARKAAAKKKAKKDEATLALPLGKSDPEGT